MVRFHNPPVWIEPSRYDEELHAFIERARRSPHVRDIWTMGSVGAPGLSDMDVIVHVDDEFQAEEGHLVSIANRDRKIFCHGALIIPHRLWERLPLMKWTSNLTLRWRRDESCGRPPARESPDFLYHATLFDNRISRRLQWQVGKSTGTADARVWTRALWSLTHAAAVLERLEIGMPDIFDETLTAIREFRAEWNLERTFEPLADRLPALFERFGTMNDLVLEVAARESARLLTGSRPPKLLPEIVVHNRRFRFRDGGPPVDVTIVPVKVGGRTRTYHDVIAERKLAYQLSTYATEADGEQTPYAAFLRERQRSVIMHSEFMTSAGRHTKGARLRTSVPVPGIRSYRSRLADSIFWTLRKTAA